MSINTTFGEASKLDPQQKDTEQLRAERAEQAEANRLLMERAAQVLDITKARQQAIQDEVVRMRQQTPSPENTPPGNLKPRMSSEEAEQKATVKIDEAMTKRIVAVLEKPDSQIIKESDQRTEREKAVTIENSKPELRQNEQEDRLAGDKETPESIALVVHYTNLEDAEADKRKSESMEVAAAPLTQQDDLNEEMSAEELAQFRTEKANDLSIEIQRNDDSWQR